MRQNFSHTNFSSGLWFTCLRQLTVLAFHLGKTDRITCQVKFSFKMQRPNNSKISSSTLRTHMCVCVLDNIFNRSAVFGNKNMQFISQKYVGGKKGYFLIKLSLILSSTPAKAGHIRHWINKLVCTFWALNKSIHF